MGTFTLFVILPSQEVCSLRHLSSGVTVREIRCKLEMLAGLPAQIYRLTGTDEKIFHEEQDLVLGKNVWDGLILRIQLMDSWQPIYDAVSQDNISWILEEGAVHIKDFKKSDNDDNDNDDESDEKEKEKEDENTRRVIRERGSVAIYLACWFGKEKMCRSLLGVGIDPNGRTPFRRSPIFACVAQDNDKVLEMMIVLGAKMSIKDCFGDTAMDVAKRNFSRQCVNRMRSLQLMRRNRTSVQIKSPTSSVSETPRSNESFNLRLDSPWMSSSVKSARINSGKISMTRNSALINNEKFSDKRSLATKDYCVSFQSQTSPRRSHSLALNSPQRSSISSASPRTTTTGRLVDKGSRTNRAASGVQFRLAISNPNSTSTNKSNNFVTWDCPLSQAEFFSVNMTKLPSSHNSQRPENENGWLHNGHLTYSSRHNPITVPSPVPSPNKGESESITQTAQSSPRISVLGDRQDKDTSTDTRSADKAPGVTDGSKGSRGLRLESGRSLYSSGTRNINGRASTRSRRMLKSGQEKIEALRAAKRRVRLAEQLKLDAKKRETFEQWLKRKRIQEQKDESKQSTDGSSSEDDAEENSQAFQAWLKDVRERPLLRPNPNSAASLHHRKSRAIQGLITIADTTPADSKGGAEKNVSSYMHSYNDWLLKKRENAKRNGDDHNLDAETAKKSLETKRLELLAMAVSFDEWMAHTEERKRLMKVILKADKNQLDEIAIEGGISTNASDGHQPISFQQWKQKVEAKDARKKMKHLRIRQQQELDQQMRESHRNSASVPHEEWIRKKTQDNLLQQSKQQQQHQLQQQPKSARDRNRNENPGQPFKAWVDKKHGQEMHRLDSGIRKEKLLLLQLKEKKHVTISSC